MSQRRMDDWARLTISMCLSHTHVPIKSNTVYIFVLNLKLILHISDAPNPRSAFVWIRLQIVVLRPAVLLLVALWESTSSVGTGLFSALSHGSCYVAHPSAGGTARRNLRRQLVTLPIFSNIHPDCTAWPTTKRRSVEIREAVSQATGNSLPHSMTHHFISSVHNVHALLRLPLLFSEYVQESHPHVSLPCDERF